MIGLPRHGRADRSGSLFRGLKTPSIHRPPFQGEDGQGALHKGSYSLTRSGVCNHKNVTKAYNFGAIGIS